MWVFITKKSNISKILANRLGKSSNWLPTINSRLNLSIVSLEVSGYAVFSFLPPSEGNVVTSFAAF